MELLSLIRSKNRCLERFMQLSIEFLADAETGDYDEIGEFQTKREGILRAMDLYNRKVNEFLEANPDSIRARDISDEIRVLTYRSDEIVAEIADIDRRIILSLEVERDRTVSEIQESKKVKNTVGRFKSGAAGAPGEELDEWA